ncbi:MAG: 6-bladed beta-propeller [Methanosarcinaceae archaeon]|nr:6-bladed beta-propeller [Methanosarcinaceae archaeon]
MRNCRVGYVFLSILFFGIQLSCSNRPMANWSGTIKMVDGVTIVDNLTYPLFAPDVFRIDEELSIGGASTKNFTISNIFDLFVDDNENMFVADLKEDCVLVFDKRGGFVRTIGGKGQGPGEFGFPRDLIVMPNKDIAVLDSINRRITFFAESGTYRKSISEIDFNLVSFEISKTGIIVGMDIVREEESSRHEIKTYSPELKFITSVDSAPIQDIKKLNPFMPILGFAINAKDQIVYGYPSSYEFKIYSIDGKLIKKIGRKYVPLEITDEDMGRTKNLPPAIQTVIPKYHSPYWSFFVDDECRIYALTWEKSSDGKRRMFDVFDEQGRYIARIPLPPRSLFIKRDRLYSVENDEEGYQHLKRYKVTWKT